MGKELKIATRLFVTHPLAPNEDLSMGDERSHFLRNVLRLGEGQHIALFNGRDGEWEGKITNISKKKVDVHLLKQRRTQGEEELSDLWLVFSLIKSKRQDLLIEKATEMGVRRLLPLLTQHRAVDKLNQDRLTSLVKEAAEQCERLSVPDQQQPSSLDALLEAWPAGRLLLYCAEQGEAMPMKDLLLHLENHSMMPKLTPREDKTRKRDIPAAVLIGPEGGFSRAEQKSLRQYPFVKAVSLGPRILRSDTAAIAALSCWQAWFGDWSRRPPRHFLLP